MILTGAPRRVTGNETTVPRLLLSVSSWAEEARSRANSEPKDGPQLRRHLGQLGELAVIGCVVSLDIRQVDDGRAQRRQFRVVGDVADPGLSATNETRRSQRLIVP